MNTNIGDLRLTEFNQRLREVYCPHCKHYLVTDELSPKCLCDTKLVTVVYSMLTREKITGNEKFKNVKLGATGS